MHSMYIFYDTEYIIIFIQKSLSISISLEPFIFFLNKKME
jgi:hypothetical protein